MNSETGLRRISVMLLTLAVRWCPAKLRPWVTAMLAELSYIESGWAALCWAIGSVWVVVGGAVPNALFGEKEVGMKRPRILFSSGAALLPIAILFLGFVGLRAYSYLADYQTVDAKVISSQGRAMTGGQTTTYITELSLEFDDHGRRQTAPSGLATIDFQENERWMREFAVGTRHSMHLLRDSRGRGVNDRISPVHLEAYDPLPRMIRMVLVVAIGGVFVSSAMLYVGKRRAIAGRCSHSLATSRLGGRSIVPTALRLLFHALVPSTGVLGYFRDVPSVLRVVAYVCTVRPEPSELNKVA